ncbi:hypothetical protein CPB86DRAFT_782778 [Serendipita vermifera]|nr:hypothetical protein CPB86DRAFT_782778 [Serendipita vermifera]
MSRHLLSNHSSVLRDMFNLPQGDASSDGSEERPVTLLDSVQGWELLLSLIFPINPMIPVDVYSGSKSDHLIPILHKYSMDEMRNAVVSHLEASQNIHDIASLMMISRILGSDGLHEKANISFIEHQEHIMKEDA